LSQGTADVELPHSKRMAAGIHRNCVLQQWFVKCDGRKSSQSKVDRIDGNPENPTTIRLRELPGV